MALPSAALAETIISFASCLGVVAAEPPWVLLLCPLPGPAASAAAGGKPMGLRLGSCGILHHTPHPSCLYLYRDPEGVSLRLPLCLFSAPGFKCEPYRSGIRDKY
jgi:hypothetical protein